MYKHKKESESNAKNIHLYAARYDDDEDKQQF